MTVRRPSGKQIHLAAHFPGADNTTVWADPRSRSQIDFASFEHLARTAERGLFDFFFLAEGLRLREHKGPIHDLDVAGRPDSLTVLNALAGVTEHLGLAATVNATFNEPYELARRLATLDHLSGGRAAWNVVASSDAFTGENFRRGGFLDRAERYTRAAEFVDIARKLWDSWTPEGVSRPLAHRGEHFDIAGEFTLPRSPQGHPVVIQAGDSDEGREFAAATADVVLSRWGSGGCPPGRHSTRHGTLEAGRSFYADVKRRLAKYGREPGDLKIMLGVTVVLGDTAAEAQERAAVIRRQTRRGDDVAIAETGIPPLGRSSRVGEAGASKEKRLSIRQTVIEAGTRQSFIGTPEAVAAELDEFVQKDAADGFIVQPVITPSGLDEFVERVVPLLQERGVFRTEYRGTTLRSHLGLSEPVRKG